MKPLRCALALSAVLFAACQSSGPGALDITGNWNVEATAPDGSRDFCALSGTFALSGTSASFTGTGDLSMVCVVGGQAQEPVLLHGATLTGSPREVMVGTYRLTVDDAGERRLAGTWDCGQGAGRWVLFRAG